MPIANITALSTHLPSATLDNEQLENLFPEWSARKILDKTGIETRHLAAEGECASDLAAAAAMKLLSTGKVASDEIDYLLFCTSAPDYTLPASACLLQARLGLPKTCGAIDVNQGCSGFIYGLGLAKGLIESGQARQVLLLTADTYTHSLHPEDHTTRTLFGDGAAATLISAVDAVSESIGPFIYGSDGEGAPHLIVRNSAARREVLSGLRGQGQDGHLWMDGPEVFNFALSTVPAATAKLLSNAGLSETAVDAYVFHQANHFMLEALRRKMQIAPARFITGYRHCGNTVSSTIPIALHAASGAGHIRNGQTLCLVGFGVGYSWAAALLKVAFAEHCA